jgi:hypothetical protein
MGGSKKAMYSGLIDTDVLVIPDMPDQCTHNCCCPYGSTSGAIAVKTRVLMSPEDPELSPALTVAVFVEVS